MKSKRWRSMALVVSLFTLLAMAMVWGLSLRLQEQLREQMLVQAEVRAMQLADAMGGQTQAFTRLVDRGLLELRAQWPSSPVDFSQAVDQAISTFPVGLVSHVSVVDANGVTVFNSLGLPVGTSEVDPAYLQRLRTDGDRLLLGEPMWVPQTDSWRFLLGRPMLREGRVDGAVHLWVSTEFLAGTLGRATLNDQDLVALVHPSGRFLARSLNNAAAMTQALPHGWPLLADQGTSMGAFRHTDAIDGTSRLVSWKRLQPSGVLLLVGLSERSVLKPLVDARQQAQLLTTLLSLVLAGVGASIGWLLLRLEAGQRLMSEGRARLQEAQRIARLGHWNLDERNGAMLWSDEVCRIFGQDPVTFQPSFSAYWQQVCPDDKAELRQLFARVLAERCDLDSVHRILRPDGVERHVRLLCQIDPGKNDRSYHGTIQDVTELRQAQLALQQLNAGLEQRVKVRTRELRALNRELESFTYSVSHDLRTPLRSIHGFASLLQESEADQLSGEGQDFLRRIQESSRRMGLLITDLLSMAKHSRAELHPEWVDLSALARQVVAELERGEPQRQVRWDIEPGLRLQADPTLMRVVLQNLLGNAWKYTGQTPQAHIRLYCTGVESDGQRGFCVSDNGAGFEMAYADQLFQPFKRLHAHHEFEGTGIGLATVARVLQRHGGRVRGEGAVGQGASFHFSLPEEPVRSFADSALSES